MPEENISIFRQELERVKTQFEDKFQDIMASVRADRENDKRTLQMVNENINNDRKAINQNRALNDKLETLLNVQNTMLSELRSMNNSIKDLSGGGGGGMGGILAAGGAAATAGAGAGFFLNGDGDNNVDGGGGNDGLRDTGGGRTRDTGGDGGTRTTSGTSDQRDTALMVYDSFINAGFSPDQARAITGEVHRENAFRNRYLFGSHSDPANQANNIGMISWQGPRRDALLQFMRDYESENEVNLFGSNGEMLQTQEVLDVQAMFLRGEMESGSHGGSQTQNERIQEWLSNPNPSNEESIQAVGGDFIRWALNNPTYRSSGLRNRQAGLDILDEALERRDNTDNTPDAERVGGNDEVTGLLNRFNIDPNSLRFDEEGRLKNELYDTEGYPIRLSPKDAEELSQGLGIELPSTMEELRSDLASRDVAVEYEERFYPGRPTSSNTEELIGRSNETIRKYYAERLGLPEDISMKEIREYMLENDISSAPALKSVMIGEGGVEDIGGMFRDLEDVTSRVQPASGPHRTVSGLPAEHMDYSQGLLAARLPEDSPLRDYLERRETLDGGGGDDIIDGGDGRDTLEPLEPQDTPLGPRIPEETPTEPTEPTEFPTLAEQFRRGESPTSMTGMDLAPAVEDALRPNLPEPPTEEDSEETPRRTTTTGGGGGSKEQEQPQIESNAIGRFPWAEKIIKYYNLSDMIKTNMLS